jgi:hypothetical protein
MDFKRSSLMLSINLCFRRRYRLKILRQASYLGRFGHKLLLIGSTVVLLSASTSFAQLTSPPDVAQFVYKRLPTLAQENQYIRSENNKQAVESTLVSRMVQYHNSTKGRSPNYRLDWKITLADYLGLNEVIQPETYPGYAFLKKNPLESDRTVIQKLNASQRNALVQALVDAFTGSQATAAIKSSTPPVPQAKPKPVPAYRPTLNPLPTPGSANSLKTLPVGSPSTSGSGDAQFLK